MAETRWLKSLLHSEFKMKDINTTSDFEDEYQEVLSPKETLFFLR